MAAGRNEDCLETHPPDPLPLIREGGVVVRGASPLFDSPFFLCGCMRGAKPLSKVSSPSPLKERGIKGVRLLSNLKKVFKAV